MKFLFNLLSIALLITSCTTNQSTKHRVMEVAAHDYGFTEKLVKGGPFWITTFQKIHSPSSPFVFYIEGDGEAFGCSGKCISSDPTPKEIMLLKLASIDHRQNIVYVARPCQYTPMEQNPACNRTYWTDKRMSEDSVNSINDVILNIAGNQKIDLIGFSGGGGIAVLVAARNKQVRSILTLAGNLNHQAFQKFHKFRPMIGSLNPIDFAMKINTIPQLHISGGHDKIVPAFIADDYIKASGNSKCVKREVFSEPTHIKKWDKYWKDILSIPITCD
jgi:alpha/beta hydrolase fold